MDSVRAIVILFHVLGVIVGMGGAFASDAMFFSSIRDRKITKTELRFMNVGSKLVWGGLFIMVLSGAYLFLSDVERLSHSPKFLAKLTIVCIIVANGLVFHLLHIPRFRRHAGHHLPSSDEFMRNRTLLLGSGVISTVSWLSAFILGSVSSLPFTYLQILGIYGTINLIGILSVLVIKNFLIPHHKYSK